MSDTGGSAFPVRHQENRNGDIITWAESGMTLRDYFAAHTLAVMLQNTVLNPMNYDVDAQHAYAMADALLKEREKL